MPLIADRRTGGHRRSVLGIVIALLGVGQVAFGQIPVEPSLERGRDIAQRLCSSCHLMPDAPSSGVIVGIPTLTAIANRPGQTGQRIETVLINPHLPMPDTHLTSGEIKDIIHYLETLRADKAAPPLLPPVVPAGKPTYPKPS